jgi:RNA polymerase sigma factor for flagellar operon FliA
MDMIELALQSEVEASLSRSWKAWRGAGDAGARERLIGHYQRHARITAAQLYGMHPYKVLEFDDYLQFASVGLIEALDRYDPDSGVRFETYSASRMRGAILDGIRRSSDVQEQISARRRTARERIDTLAPDGDRTDDVDRLFADLADVAVGLAIGLVLDGTGMYQAEEDAGGESAYQAVELAQLARRLRALVRSLPANQREVVSGHYLQQMSFSDIAEQLRLSRGRVAQLHKEALERLRQMLAHQGIGAFSC